MQAILLAELSYTALVEGHMQMPRVLRRTLLILVIRGLVLAERVALVELFASLQVSEIWHNLKGALTIYRLVRGRYDYDVAVQTLPIVRVEPFFRAGDSRAFQSLQI